MTNLPSHHPKVLVSNLEAFEEVKRGAILMGGHYPTMSRLEIGVFLEAARDIYFKSALRTTIF